MEKNYGYIVDAPGYGYADINVNARLKWQGMILDYIRISTRLSRIFLCIRATHKLTEHDLTFLYKVNPDPPPQNLLPRPLPSRPHVYAIIID